MNPSLLQSGDSVKEGDLNTFKELKLSELLQKANTLPKNSGCYFMKNKRGEVIYVGKAKNLKNRVTSYFNNSAKSPKTQLLVSHIKDFEFIITSTEAESYVLENNLIKEYRPKYNIRLKDDKSYPYLMVNLNEAFPRLEYVRRPKSSKGKLLFGPFPTGSNISEILRILTKAFKLRDCSLHDFQTRKTPCLLYQMNQCTAPCVGYISKDEYQKNLEKSLDIFRGERAAKSSVKFLKEVMTGYAENEEYEKAANLRDMIFELERFLEESYKQSVEFSEEKNIDVLAYYKGEEELDISLYMIRQGALLGHKSFHFASVDAFEELEQEIMTFMTQYYSQYDGLLPDLLITDFTKDSVDVFSEVLSKLDLSGRKIKVMGNSKKFESLLNSTKKHAEETQRVRLLNQDSEYIGLNKLKELLKLKTRPRTLECYDIAIWQGKSPTASQIVFHDGSADKKSYRYYHLEERPEGNNDFAMMKEVFERRLQKGNLPDVFIVDGGVAQVNTVLKVLESFEINIPVVGIAKARDLTKGNLKSKEISRSDERLVIPGRSNPFILSKSPSLFRIVVQMRDEAHRFSRKLHHKAENKRIITSWLDNVHGIGVETRNHILSHMSVTKEELKEWNAKKIQDFFGINSRQAKSIYDYLQAGN